MVAARAVCGTLVKVVAIKENQMIDSLIARLEKATGPDRELDQAIAAEIGLSFPKWPPFYTESIDSAMTLVPEGKLWEIRKLKKYERATNKQPFYAEVGIDEGWSETAALAICIAAMKARARKE